MLPRQALLTASLRLRLLLAAVVGLALSASPLTAEARVQADQVCSVSCDTLDPSKAQEETFPVPEKVINGRHDRDSLNRLGQRWAGGGSTARDWRTQASALSGLLAATSKS